MASFLWGLLLPLGYLTILIGSLYSFSHFYRQRKAMRAASLQSWWTTDHLPRNIYLSLLHYEPEEGDSKSAKVPDSVLKAALLRRATEDIHRIIAVRNAKQALSTLLQKGCVGDELWQRFLRAEKEIEEELRDVVNEVCFPPLPFHFPFHYYFDVVSWDGMANNAITGQRIRPRLGPSDLPVRQRDGQQRHDPQAHGRAAGADAG